MEKKRILVVDDHPKISNLVGMFLERTLLYIVAEENRPTHVLETARQFKPDAILLDVNMPGKDGADVALELSRDAEMQDVPVLFVTSLVSGEEAGKQEVRMGGNLYLSKPINPSALVAAVGRLLDGVEPVPA